MLSYLLIGIFTGAAYGLLAVGFVLVYKGTRIFNLAQGEIGAVGLYVAWSLLHVLPVALASLVGIAIAAVVGLLMEATLARRLVDRTPLSALAATLGVALSLAWLQVLLWGATIKTYPSPVGDARITMGAVTMTAPRIAALVVAGVVAVSLGLFLRRTRFGLAVWSATSDQALARLSGVDVTRVRRFIWGLGGALSGVSAILLAAVYTFHPLSNTLILVRAMAAALLGGLVSIPGAFVGGIAIGVVESLVISQTNIGGAVDAAIFAVILATLLLKPEGLFGVRGA